MPPGKALSMLHCCPKDFWNFKNVCAFPGDSLLYSPPRSHHLLSTSLFSSINAPPFVTVTNYRSEFIWVIRLERLLKWTRRFSLSYVFFQLFWELISLRLETGAAAWNLISSTFNFVRLLIRILYLLFILFLFHSSWLELVEHLEIYFFKSSNWPLSYDYWHALSSNIIS